ncbi:plasmid mobilization protein [Blautia sp.]|uniref:Bacterial mobilisation protein (MobC) n=1 Tax=Blautia glucerasea TaxID=536633 RepID=A0A6N2SD16_9FIRM
MVVEKKRRVRKEKCEFRCTEAEKKEIMEAAKKCGLPSSEFLRRKVFQKSEKDLAASIQIEKMLKDLDWKLSKIGVNINQIARMCNSKKFVSRAEGEEIKKYMNLVSYYFSELLTAVLNTKGSGNGEAGNGDYKITED